MRKPLIQRVCVKIVMNAVLIPLLYLQTSASVTEIITTSIVFSLVAFAVGDQWILRGSNNAVATIADAAMAGLYFWMAARLFHWGLSNGELFVLVVLLGAVEAMYHRLLAEWDNKKTAFSETD